MDKRVTRDDLDIRNIVLAALKREDRLALQPHCQFVSLSSGDNL